MKINCTINIGTTKIPGENLIDLEINHSLNIPANSCKLIIVNSNKFQVKNSDDLSVTINDETVFTGKVNRISVRLTEITIEALSSISALNRSSINAWYEKKSTGDIVKELAGLYDIKTGTIEDGITWPFIAIDRGKTVYQHMKILAGYSGLDLYTDKDDKLNMKKYSGENSHEISYGKDILETEKSIVTPVYDGVEVYGESPAGQGQSEEACYWLKKEEFKGTSGKNSGNILRIREPLARNQDIVDKIAENLFNSKSAIAVQIINILEGLKSGICDEVKIRECPDDSLNSKLKIVSVTHTLNHETGLITEVKGEEF